MEIEGREVSFTTIDPNQPESNYDPKQVAADYRAALWKTLLRHRASALTSMLGAWLLPLIALYALGWSVGWIRRGFAR